jgi:alkylation response protein AidB-like acyl-CoA dehydrogenase
LHRDFAPSQNSRRATTSHLGSRGRNVGKRILRRQGDAGVDRGWRSRSQERCSLLVGADPGEMEAEDFVDAQFDAGLAWAQFHPGFAGLGVHVSHQPMVKVMLAERKSPSSMRSNRVAYGPAGGPICDFGRETQRSQWGRPMFSCRDICCQLFGELRARRLVRR